MDQSIFRQRIRFAARLAIKHFAVCMLIASGAAWLVFGFWYAGVMSTLFRVSAIYFLLLGVDVVCGPLLTLVLASPDKSRRELIMDLSLIGAIQLTALGYGLYVLEESRPVAIVFEADRLVAVGKNELYLSDCAGSELGKLGCEFPPWRKIEWTVAKKPEDVIKSMELSLQGVSVSMRPVLWQKWNWDNAEIQKNIKPIAQIEDKLKKIEKAGDELSKKDLFFLPLTSSRDMNWIAVFDRDGKWLDSMPIDGFI